MDTEDIDPVLWAQAVQLAAGLLAGLDLPRGSNHVAYMREAVLEAYEALQAAQDKLTLQLAGGETQSKG